MNAYQIFKNEIDDICEEMDTFLFILDKNLTRTETVGSVIDRYIDMADRLKEAFENLKKEEGETLIADIEYEGKLSNSKK